MESSVDNISRYCDFFWHERFPFLTVDDYFFVDFGVVFSESSITVIFHVRHPVTDIENIFWRHHNDFARIVFGRIVLSDCCMRNS